MLQIITWSRQTVLTDTFSQTPQKIVFAFVYLFSVHFSFVWFSLISQNKKIFLPTIHLRLSNPPAPPSMMYNAEWLDTISRRAFSNHSLYMYVQTDRRWIIFLPIFGIAVLVIKSLQMVGKASERFIKYYIFCCGALFSLCLSWCLKAAAWACDCCPACQRPRSTAVQWAQVRCVKQINAGSVTGGRGQYHVYLGSLCRSVSTALGLWELWLLLLVKKLLRSNMLIVVFYQNECKQRSVSSLRIASSQEGDFSKQSIIWCGCFVSFKLHLHRYKLEQLSASHC